MWICTPTIKLIFQKFFHHIITCKKWDKTFWNLIFVWSFSSLIKCIQYLYGFWIENRTTLENSAKIMTKRSCELKIFFVTVWPPGGITITLAKNLNFWLKFIAGNPLCNRMIFKIFWFHFFFKNESKMPKN